MRNYLTTLYLTLLFGCQSHSSEQSTKTESETQPSEKTTASITPDTLCFQQIMSRDTTTVQLIFTGKKVTGYLDINRYEKDRARGPLSGDVKPERIRTDWMRSGEGVTQKYILDIIRTGDTLRWREGEFVKKEQGWVAKEPNVGYLHVLTKIDCPPTPLR